VPTARTNQACVVRGLATPAPSRPCSPAKSLRKPLISLRLCSRIAQETWSLRERRNRSVVVGGGNWANRCHATPPTPVASADAPVEVLEVSPCQPSLPDCDLAGAVPLRLTAET